MKKRGTPPSTDGTASGQSSSAAASGIECAFESDIDRMVARTARRAALYEAIVEALAQIARFVQEPWRIDERRVRFDGRLMFAAAAALARYDRLTDDRLHARLGFVMNPALQLPDEVRQRVRRARDACLSDLAQLPSVSRADDLRPMRRALRMEGAEQTPEQSVKRQRYRDLATIVRENLRRRVWALWKHVRGTGKPLPGENMTAIYLIVASSFSGHGERVSSDTVRRAWISEQSVAGEMRVDPGDDAILKELVDERESLSDSQLEGLFDLLRAKAKAKMLDDAARPSEAPKPVRKQRSMADSPGKKSIDRVMSKKK
jgi:hypothetical protein